MKRTFKEIKESILVRTEELYLEVIDLFTHLAPDFKVMSIPGEHRVGNILTMSINGRRCVVHVNRSLSQIKKDYHPAANIHIPLAKLRMESWYVIIIATEDFDPEMYVFPSKDMRKILSEGTGRSGKVKKTLNIPHPPRDEPNVYDQYRRAACLLKT